MPPAMNPEMVPNLPPLNTQFERGSEHVEQLGEARARAANAAGTGYLPPAAVPMPAQPVDNNATAPQQQQSTAGPLIAADEDLIEKEWVDRAKEIIEQTPDDPYTRNERVGQLQRDYLQKRWNRVVGADDSGA